MNVEWREVKTHPDYIVSSDGQVGSRWLGKFRMLKPTRVSTGYLQVGLCDGRGGKKNVNVHTLVAEAFLGPRPTPAHQLNHKNGIKDDNRDANFEWCTASENRRHALDVLGVKVAHGAALPQTKVTEAEVREIRRRCAAGEPQRGIAASYGITQTAVSLIARRARWAWLK